MFETHEEMDGMLLETIINLGLVAHVDAGKTTTTEQLLYLCGETRAPGSVDGGTAQTDWLPVERARGISVRAASAVLRHGGFRINLIDTPGHTDFAGEVERALSVLDGAVLLLSAAEGVQGHTLTLWRALEQLGIPTILFVNKIDRDGCDLGAVIAQVRKELTDRLFFYNEAEGMGTRACKTKPLPLANEDTLLALAGQDEVLEDRYLAEQPIPPQMLRDAARRLTAERRIFPVVLGASAVGAGMEDLLDAVTELLPSVPNSPDGPLSGVVYQVEHDPAMGKVAHVRLYSGAIQSRDSVPLYVPGQETPASEKVTQVRQFQGQKYRDTGVVMGGDIAALYGLSSARTGMVIGEPHPGRAPGIAVPLFTVQVLPASEADLTRLVAAMGELSDEEPLLDFLWQKEERELHIKIMGPIQLEVLSTLLLERYDLTVSFSPPSVIYKETPTHSGEGFTAYTMPKPCWAVIRLAIDPLPRGAGYRFESIIGDNQIAYRYQNHIETTVPRALAQGLYGWEVTDCKVTLIGGEHHHVHTHPLDFFLATPMAVMDGLEHCGTTLLEPMLTVRLSAAEEVLGRVIGDITGMRGTFDSPVITGDRFTMEARIPAATSMEYPAAFAALTSGKGTYAAQFAGYQECPLELGKTAKRRGVDPRDRAKWILYNRNALQ